MQAKSEQVIKSLQKFGEDIDTFNLKDQSAWNKLAEEIRELIKTIPQDLKPVLQTLDLCCRGVVAIGENNANDPMGLIDLLYDAFGAIENLLKEHPVGEDIIQDSQQQLAEALGIEIPQFDGQPQTDISDDDQDETAAAESHLNEAAIMVVQLEPQDWDDMGRFRDLMIKVSQLKSLPKAVVTIVTQLQEKVSGLIDQKKWPENLVEETGKQVEAAMIAMQDALDEEALSIPQEADTKADHIDSGAAEQTIEKASAEALDQTIDEDSCQPIEGKVTDGIPLSPEETPSPELETVATQTESEPEEIPSAVTAEPDTKDYMPEDADTELIGEFITEGGDLISSAEEALLSLENDPEDQEAVGTVFRAFHTVKGTAAFMELDLIAEMGHHAESLLSRVRDKEIRYAGGYADLSLRALDMIKDLVTRVQEALASGGPLMKPGGYDELMHILADPEAAGVSDEAELVAAPRLGDILVAQGADREAVEAAATEPTDKPLGQKLLDKKGAKVTEVAQALRTQERMKGARHLVETSVRVSTSRLDRLIDMVGEMVIAHSMVAQDDLVVDGQNHDLAKKVTLTSKIVRELQDMSMSLRMVPLKATFNKMGRLVRDVGRKVGKQVNLITEGEETEIDRNLVDIIGDPLVHMVRNAVDHGIESPEVRQEIGKPLAGTVKLAAYHSAGSVVVEIQDDGKGLNKDGLLKKAKERGVIGDDAEKSMSDREIYNLIFEPGFSTAEQVTDVSGRGVGMDVVKRNIESLRGSVEIRSELGSGSIFKMALPLTLAIIDGMVIRVGKETYVIPTVSIVRSIKPGVKDISTVMNRGNMLSIQGALIPLFRLADLYKVKGAKAANDNPLVVVVEDEGRQAGIIIDELIGRQQVVIKSLGEALQDVKGISGAAIMPNGRVGLIIDVGGLVRFADVDQGDKTSAREESKRAEKAQA